VTRLFETGAAPHFPAQTSVRKVMLQVLLALLPGIAAHAWFFGPGIWIQILLSCSFALVLEAASLALRRKPLKPFMTDLSAPVTAVLFALCLPPLAPWWIALIGMFFAIVIAKHLFGGLGHNLFNPAMVAYVVVLISFPQAMTAWLPPMEIAAWEPTLGEVIASITKMASGLVPPPLFVTLLLLLTSVFGSILMSPLPHAASAMLLRTMVNRLLRVIFFSGKLACAYRTPVQCVIEDRNSGGVSWTSRDSRVKSLLRDAAQDFSENRYPVPRTVCT